MSGNFDSPTPSSATPTPEDTPSPSSSPGPETVNKFNWLKHAKNARTNPFVKARPTLNRESSTAELFSRENSSSDFFQNSTLNLFDTAPKPEPTHSYGKVKLTQITRRFIYKGSYKRLIKLWIHFTFFFMDISAFVFFRYAFGKLHCRVLRFLSVSSSKSLSSQTVNLALPYFFTLRPCEFSEMTKPHILTKVVYSL